MIVWKRQAFTRYERSLWYLLSELDTKGETEWFRFFCFFFKYEKFLRQVMWAVKNSYQVGDVTIVSSSNKDDGGKIWISCCGGPFLGDLLCVCVCSDQPAEQTLCYNSRIHLSKYLRSLITWCHPPLYSSLTIIWIVKSGCSAK